MDDVAVAALHENLFQLAAFQLADGAGAGGQCGRAHGGDAVLVRASCKGRVFNPGKKNIQTAFLSIFFSIS